MPHKKLIVIIIGLALVGGGVFFYYQASQNVFPKQVVSVEATISEVTQLLSSIGISDLSQWKAGNSCGPADEFLGYTLSSPYKVISLDQAAQLKSLAARKYEISNWGAERKPPTKDFRIFGSGWEISVFDSTEGKLVLDILISPIKFLKEIPSGIPYESRPCG